MTQPDPIERVLTEDERVLYHRMAKGGYVPPGDCAKSSADLIHRLAARVAELEAIVNELPLTADGVRKTPYHPTVYHPTRGPCEIVWCVDSGTYAEPCNEPPGQRVPVRSCYSTEAKAKQEKGGGT